MTKLCRCSSCGFVHPQTDTDYLEEAVPVAVAVVAPVSHIPPVIQPTVCPLCRELFTDPVLYDRHRAANCAPVVPDEPVAPVEEPAAGGENVPTF